MKHSQKRTFMDIEKMSSDEFKAFCRLGNKNHFTRIRKMPLQDLLFTMINRKGLTLALELRNYMKLIKLMTLHKYRLYKNFELMSI